MCASRLLAGSISSLLIISRLRQDAIPADGIIRKIEIKRLKVDEQIPDSGFYYE